MRPISQAHSRGFTLIELMITLVILAIVLTAGAQSYSVYIQNSRIRLAAESVQHGLQRARVEAVVRNTPVAFVLGGGDFWAVSVVGSGEVIEARPLGEVTQSVSLAVEPAGATTVTFTNLGTVTGVGITRIDIDSTVLASEDSRELRVTIGAGGIARMCDPDTNIDTSDPRHC